MSRNSDNAPVNVAVVNFFPAFTPPGSGGEMRYGCLYERLTRHGFRIRMVNPTHPFVEPETVVHNPLWTEFRVPQTMLHHRLYQFLRRGLGQGECSAAVVSLASRFHGEFLERAREAIRESQIVIFDYPMPLGPFFKGMRGHRPLLVHNAYNVEGLMQRETLRGPQGKMIAAWTDRVQKTLCRKADLVFACSREDAATMADRFKMDPTKIFVIPNGVDPNEISPVDLEDEAAAIAARKSLGLDGEGPCALFLGGNHPPNIEAARFLMEKVAPACPEIHFVIAGAVCEDVRSQPPENVRLFGKFENDRKAALLQSATVAVNPMFSGSGTNLKMLEFFAAGLPVLATPVGARGLSPAPHETPCFETASAGDFASRLSELAADEKKRAVLGAAARRAVLKSYDWDRIAEDAAEILHHKIRPRVLVLNDYPVSPVTFGGKVRLFHHYRAVARHTPVTILTETPENRCGRRALAPHLEEINIPGTRLKTLAKKLFFALVGTPGDDIVAYLTVRWNRAMRRAFERESRFAKCIVLTHPYMVSLVRDRPSAPVVYESHNVESLLKRKMYGDGFWARQAAQIVRRCENEAVRRADALTVCSEEDGVLFRRLYLSQNGAAANAPRIFVATTGVDCEGHRRMSLGLGRSELRKAAGIGNEPVVVFLASGHPPNAKAGRFIIEEIAPKHPEALFLIAGSVCHVVNNSPRRNNTLLLYEVEETVKNRLLALADVALNPLVTDSGASSKAMDYLAAGTTVLSTPDLGRCVAIENGVNGVLCLLESFSEELGNLVGDPERCRAIGEKGRELAREKYDWSVTTRSFIEFLETMDARGRAASAGSDR